MTIQLHDDIDAFLDLCSPLLEQYEVENGLMLGLMLREQANQKAGKEANIRLISIYEGNELVSVAMQTPPHHLILSRLPDHVRRPLAQFVIDNDFVFRGIVGPDQEVKRFASIWSELSGKETGLEFGQMIYRLDEVQDIRVAPGTCHQATLVDLDLVGQWFLEFANAALPAQEQYGLEKAREKAKARIEKGEIFLWKDGEIFVSMAGSSGPTRNGIRINAVYTPPAFRGKGYASNNVAAASQKQLDAGYEFCFLYTDISNPTSNKIYQQIGYRFVCDSSMYAVTSE